MTNDNELDAEPQEETDAFSIPAAASPKATTKINRIGMGTMITIQLVLAFICVVLLNYLTAPHHLRKDLTATKDFTLSEYSNQFLHSDLIQNYKGKIRIIALLKPHSPHKARIRSILEEYRRQAPNTIEFEIVDYIKEANRFNELSAIYGKTFFEETILIDARTDAERMEDQQVIPATDGDAQPLLSSTKHSSAHRIRQFPVSSLYVVSEDGSRIAAWQDEKIITSFLLSAAEGKSRKFYFIVDKSQVDDAGGGTPAWRAFSAHLDSQNIRLAPFQISAGEPIPKDAEGIAIIGLDSDFDSKEIKILKEYWDRNGAAIFMTINPDAKLSRIRRFLKEYGIAIARDRVITNVNGHTLTKARATFTKGSEITKGFGDKATQLDGPSRSISLANTDKLAVQNIAVFPLILAAPGWWGEVNYNKPHPKFDLGKDIGSDPKAPVQRPIYLAAAVVRGREDLERTKHLTSRMIVISNTQFLKPSNMRDELTHFVNSAINWLAGREELVGTIGTKPAYQQKITITEEDKSRINIALIGVLPGITLLIAFIVWFNRRA